MPGRRSVPARAVVALALLAVLGVPRPALSASPGTMFPDFASRKASLGPIALIVDVLEMHNVKGHEKKVYLPDCMQIGQSVLDSLAGGLTQKGYQVRSKTLLTVGAQARDDFSYRIYSTTFKERKDSDESRVAQPPFFADTTVLRTPGPLALWTSVVGACWIYEKKKGSPGKPIPEAVELRKSLDADLLFVVHVYHSRVSTGNRVGMAMLGISKEDSHSYSIAMIDGRTGEVLWADHFWFEGPGGGGYDEKDARFIANKLLKPMP